MRIFDESKTQELCEESLDYNKGHLIPDKVFKLHHDAVGAIKAKTAQEIANEMQTSGRKVAEINGKLYEVVKVFDNGGKHVEEIKPQSAVDAVDAWDEYEDVYVYKLYTQEELLEIKKDELRAWREDYFRIIDRAVWFDSLSEDEKASVRKFRIELLNITETMIKPTIPECIRRWNHEIESN